MLLLMLMPTMVTMALAMVDMEGTVDGVDMVGTPEERRGMPMPNQLLMLNPMLTLTLMLMPTMVTMVLGMVDMEDMEDMVYGVEKGGMLMPNQLLLLMLTPTMVTMVLAMVDMEVMVDTEDMVDMVLGMVDIEVMVDMVSGVEKRGTLMLSQLLMQMQMLMP